MDARSWLPRRIPDQRVTIKMIKLHYQDWEHYLGLSLDSRSSCTRQKRNNMQLCHLMEWVRPYIAKGQPFSQAQASWLTPYLFTFPVSQSCRDEFSFLITVSAKLPLRRGLVKSPESLELEFSVLKSLIKFGIPGIRWGLAWVKRESSPHPGERCLASWWWSDWAFCPKTRTMSKNKPRSRESQAEECNLLLTHSFIRWICGAGWGWL